MRVPCNLARVREDKSSFLFAPFFYSIKFIATTFINITDERISADRRER